MRRRELLQAATAAVALPAPGRSGRRQADDAGWAFALDARARWTLAPARGVPVVAGGEIAAEFAGGPPVFLGSLSATRRFRFGERGETGGWSLVGTAEGVEVTARFEDGAGPDARRRVWPRITVSVRGLEGDRRLAAIHFLDTAAARVPTLATTRRGARVWVNGHQSWSPCRVVALGADGDATGHWQLATLGTETRTGGRADPGGLGLAFGSDDSGEGRFLIGPSGVRAVSFFGGRLVGAAYPPAIATLTIVPSPSPLGVLGALAADVRTAALPDEVPAGWCSWYELYGNVTEADVVANIEVARRTFDRRFFRVIQIDDGFQRAAGDWDTNDKFPHGHRWLTDAIHEAGFQAGLWIAPFAVADRAAIPVARPRWLLRDEGGEPLVFATREDWGGRIYGLDASRREVQEHLRDLMRHAVADWGYDYLKLDFLYYGAQGTREGRWQSGAETYRAGLRAMREGAGRAFLLGCGAPLQQAAGLFDGMRIGADVDATWEGIQPAATAALQRAHLHRRAWHNDPDALLVREPLTLAEARAWTSVVALSGGMMLASDHLPRLGAERLELLKRTLPVAPVAGHALDLATPERITAPALYAGPTRVAALPTRWRFRPGDDAAWSAAELDDSTWELIEAGRPWEGVGREELDGFAWYRARFTAPRRPPVGPLVLDLGRIDDCDETFVNGRRVGATGAMPPHYESRWQEYRRYAVPRECFRWGRENVVAIRVYDGGGPGGFYSFRRDRPPSFILAPVRSDRWMLAACNWDDEERRMTLDIGAHGIAGPLLAYDVWRDARAGDVDGRWSARVAPRSATVLALRRKPRAPCVIGSTRHVVQGVVDLADERWDARRRVLSARAVKLDDRPYAVTIALPAGFRARACRSEIECRLEGARTGGQADERTGGRTAAAAGSVRLLFPAPEGRDFAWEVEF
jgi:hypothetical protein